MRVEEIMTSNVGTCRPNEKLSAAAEIMWREDCGSVPVIDGANRRVIGMITDRDICIAAYLSGQPLDAITVRSAMTSTVHSCGPQDPLSVAERIMREAQIRRLPVVDEHGQLMGIISLGDIALTATTADEIAQTITAISKSSPQLPQHIDASS